MADKSFGVKELNLLNASGTPTVTSPNNLNLNANTVAISTSCTIGNNLTVTSTTNSANLNVTGIGTLTRGFATDLSVSGISTISQPSNANPHSLWDVVNNGSSAYRFTGPGQSGDENNPNIYLVRGQRYIFKVNASGHPFQLRVANGGAAYSDGVTNNGAQSGNVVINVQHDAPAQLYYQCTNHGSMVGNIYIVGGPQVISGVVTATTFVGNLTGNPTGTLQTAAQPNITSVGTLSSLSVSGDFSIADKIVHTGDTNTAIRFPAADTITAETSGSERLRIASNGDFGFNDTAPTAHASGNNTVLSIKGKGSSYSGKIDFKDSDGNIDSYINSDNSILQFYADPNSQNGNTLMRFYVHGGERVRIASAGQIGLGGANYGSSGQVLTSQGSSSAPVWASPAGNTQSSYVSAPTNNNNYNFSGIPSSAYRVIINYYNISSNSQSYLYSRVGHSGGYQTSGYKYIIGYHYYDVTDSTETDYSNRAPLFTTNWDSGSYKWCGFQQFDKIYASGSQNAWLINTHTVENTGSGWQRLLFHGRGIVEMGSNTLDRVQLHTSSGNFDSGYIKVDYYT